MKCKYYQSCGCYSFVQSAPNSGYCTCGHYNYLHNEIEFGGKGDNDKDTDKPTDNNDDSGNNGGDDSGGGDDDWSGFD